MDLNSGELIEMDDNHNENQNLLPILKIGIAKDSFSKKFIHECPIYRSRLHYPKINYNGLNEHMFLRVKIGSKMESDYWILKGTFMTLEKSI